MILKQGKSYKVSMFIIRGHEKMSKTLVTDAKLSRVNVVFYALIKFCQGYI